MFGIGMTELIVILVVALIVFGPNRLPELARSLGKAMNEFRRASTDLRHTLHEASEAPPPQASERVAEARAPSRVEGPETAAGPSAEPEGSTSSGEKAAAPERHG
jgi:sec-independent protein translocase protein TatB